MLDRLNQAVRADAAIRRVRRLQPAGGKGDKIFPPTYPGERNTSPPRHVFEDRRIDGEDVKCVLIDSVQSQANRLEEALREALDAGRIALPLVTVDFGQTPLQDLGALSSLDAPHRVFDAILRDSDHNGKPFRDSDLGRRLVQASMRDATALFEISPTDLVFGAWNSTGQGGGLGAKFPRVIVSEIVGIHAVAGARTSSRIDPLGASKDVRVTGDQKTWQPAPPDKDKGTKRPSEINHGNIAPSIVESISVTVDHAIHRAVISLAGLRRLSFPNQGARDRDRDAAARTVLAAIALAALLEQERQGFALRSRCDLVGDPEAEPAVLEIVRADGTTEALDLDADAAAALVGEAAARATAAGLAWNTAPTELIPQPRLVELVTQSRQKALAGEAKADDSDA